MPPQLGHLKRSFDSVQEAQNVHSNVQMNASAEDGGRSVLQHSQFGLSSSIEFSLRSNETEMSYGMVSWQTH